MSSLGSAFNLAVCEQLLLKLTDLWFVVARVNVFCGDWMVWKIWIYYAGEDLGTVESGQGGLSIRNQRGRQPTRRGPDSRGTSRSTSRATSPDAMLTRRYGSMGSHQGSAPVVGSLSSALTGSYIANLRTKDFASGAFRRVWDLIFWSLTPIKFEAQLAFEAFW